MDKNNHLFPTPPESEDTPPHGTILSTPASGSPRIDSHFNARAFIKASQTLMGEIVPENLLLKMVDVMIENSGAQWGFLLFKEKNNWLIRAQGTSDGKAVFPVNTHATPSNIPITIIDFVAACRKTLILKNAARNGFFIKDDYITEKRPLSILCTPIIHQQQPLCIIYLENNLESDTFDQQRKELIELIGSQAALSLRNSNLYAKFSSTVEQLHAEIKKRRETQLQLLHSEKLSALGRLSASIAHEFGNPLIGVRYLIDDIKKRPSLSQEDRDLLQIGLEECDRMKRLINDLQQLNRPSSGKLKRFNIHNIIDNVLLFQKKNLIAKKITIIKAYDYSLPDITAVEDQITQVLVNLTINAVDAMPAEGGSLTIATMGKPKTIIISIKDTGIGIHPEYQDHIFEPFFSTKPDAEGTGLGLPVSYGIIRGHGGKIDFSSQSGKGSTFTVTLPVESES